MIPELPEKLKEFHCTNNQLTHIPTLPPNLEELVCRNNEIEVLPTLPITLKKLNASNNRLCSLPVLPRRLVELQCDNNDLRFLPALPDSLELLDCSMNTLEVLPKPPLTIKILECETNNWNTVFQEYLSCSTTPLKAIYAYHKNKRKLKRRAAAVLETASHLGKSVLNTDVLTKICSYMSGFTGSVSKQMTALKREYDLL
jgi:Leucine-rich repeat (LRR) protein